MRRRFTLEDLLVIGVLPTVVIAFAGYLLLTQADGDFPKRLQWVWPEDVQSTQAR